MKFESRPTQGNVNVTSGHPLKDFFDLSLRIIGVLFLVYFLLGWLVDILAVKIPPQFEDKLAKTFSTKFDQYNFTELEKYSTDLANKLASLTDQLNGRTFTVYVMPGEEPNAFAWPGGHIVLTAKLFDAVKSENELAMVLGHELGHYVHRDHLRGLGRGLVLLTISVAIFGSESQISNPLANLLSNTHLNYSREQETQADLFGIELLFKSFGHVGGAYAFFNYDEKKSKLPAWLRFSSSHPTSQSRLDTLKQFSETEHWPAEPVKAFPPYLGDDIEKLIKDKKE